MILCYSSQRLKLKINDQKLILKLKVVALIQTDQHYAHCINVRRRIISHLSDKLITHYPDSTIDIAY